MATFRSSSSPAPLSRTDTGKWLGGVCAGIARARGVHPAWIRAGFVVAALIGGIGVLAYLACWLIIPLEGERPGEPSPSSGSIVGVAQACAAFAAVGTVAGLAAVATLFGFGWIAVALAAAVLLVVLLGWPRLGPGWALLPVAAIALPSAAVAASGVQLSTRTGHVTVVPAVLRASGSGNPTYRAGLGTMLVDLRRTALPASGNVPVHIQGGIRRTIIALPADRCLHIELHYRLEPLLTQLASQVAGRQPRYTGVTVFGTELPRPSGQISIASSAPGPVLDIDFDSTGGSLYLRDYPDATDPELDPYWPGFPVYPEPRPDTRGVPKHAAQALIRHWKARLRVELASKRQVDLLMLGPCHAPGSQG
jgi:phage shock protein PspC (stress-responsive transcriptional regulator)